MMSNKMTFSLENYINTVVCNDSRQFLKLLPDASIDAVITDPPYGMERFETDHGGYLGLLKDVSREWQRVLKLGHWCFVFCGTKNVKEFCNAIPLYFHRLLTIDKINDCAFPWRGWILKTELILIFSNSKDREDVVELVDRRPYRHDTYRCTGIGQEGVEGHPTVKPLTVTEDLVNRIPVGKIVLDPFAGSGTTCVACKNLDRRFIGVEIESKYVQIARKRLQQEVLKLKVVQQSPIQENLL